MKDYFEYAAQGIEVAGVGILIVGLLVALGRAGVLFARSNQTVAYQSLRRGIGRALLLALEFLVASDIIYTIAVEPTFSRLGMLGLLVVIRTFLSFTLDVEVTGRWPWQERGEVPEKP